ncbi:hypothetical protein FSP39_014178 [Pinctada imbricata]|uniref:Conserved oligomeric Golgi complex subunit 1 n=1 Tax=Pinctada imbricata TaxID=66713 RepID=A0AA89C0Y1_PINIB|nr:hypothetical protein FSP39_014178 [Pinctada imbricata]
MDTNILFEKFTVDEVRAIEKKTRADIERKKEDLRTMVGERYRDLIEAADTITEMKNSAHNVMQSINRMESLCKELKQRHMVKGSLLYKREKPDNSSRKHELKFYGIASQIKLLLDMPEKIWSALDTSDYLTAARHYLLSRHVHTSLQLDSQQSPDLLSMFPVLTRQWAAISHFRSTILQGCRSLLRDAQADDQQIADCLCTIILLEDSTPRQVFNEFLLARTSAVQQLFKSNQQTSSIKEQTTLVIHLITTTIHQIYVVFFSGQSTVDAPCNLLLKILTEVTSKKQQETGLLEAHGTVSAKCLPRSVLEFMPSLRSHAVPVSLQQLQENSQQWINTCLKDVTSGLGKLLGFVNTVKRLADIRDALWEQLKQDHSMSLWGTVCSHVLNRSLSVWEDFLQDLFIDRAKALIKYQLDTATEMTKRHVTKVVMEIGSTSESISNGDTDLAEYIWHESSGDITQNMAWTTAAARSTSDNPGGLIMKAKAYTPFIQSLCKNYDEKLSSMMEDVSYYTQKSEDSVTMETPDGTEPFDRFSKADDLTNHIQMTCSTCIKELLDYLTEQIILWEKSLSEISDHSINIITQNKILLVGRLSYSLCEMAPSLQQCIAAIPPGKKTESLSYGKKSMKLSSSKIPDDPRWAETKQRLVRCQSECNRIWSNYLSDWVIRDLKQNLQTKKESDIITSCTRWDEVDIQEETEDGKKISSKIRVPMQASWYIHSLLYKLCKEINRVGGHAVHRSTLQNIVHKVSDGIVSCYESVIQESRSKNSTAIPLTQQRALQMLFDMKYVIQVIPRKEEGKENQRYNQRCKKIIDMLEEKVDPFDLDVFTPFMQSHLLKQGQRSAVLFGSITCLDKLGLYSGGRSSQTGQSEQHNVLPLTQCTGRFTLLPISSQPTRSSLPAPVLKQSLYKVTDSGMPSLTEKAAAVLPHSTSQKDVGSSFYNKLGSMSSMSDISNWFSNIGNK